MSQSIITLGIGGTSEITWLVLTGLHGDTGPLLIVGDPDNFAYVRGRNKRAYVAARNKRAYIAVRNKRAIVEK